MHPNTEALLKFFRYDHLPEKLQDISRPFADLAQNLAEKLDGPELTAGLRKLLEAKDCAVRAALSLVLLLLLPLLTGCATMRAIIPGGVTAADAEWSGVAGAPISVVGSIASTAKPDDPRIAAAVALLQLAGLQDPLGVLLPVTPPGETAPRWVLCTAEWAAKCQAVPLNAHVEFGGSPIGPGVLWRPSRLKF